MFKLVYNYCNYSIEKNIGVFFRPSMYLCSPEIPKSLLVIMAFVWCDFDFRTFGSTRRQERVPALLEMSAQIPAYLEF